MGDKCYAKRRTYAVVIESALDTGNWAWMRYPKNSANLKSEVSARPGPNLKQHRRQIWHMPCVHIRAFYLIISTSSLSIGRISICSEYYVNWHKSLINKSLAHPPHWHLNHFFSTCNDRSQRSIYTELPLTSDTPRLTLRYGIRSMGCHPHHQ